MQELVGNWAYIAEFVKDWGYVAVFLGSLIEGESVIFMAGFFAHEGYLSLPKIIIVSFIGTLFADQALYFVGRSYGNPFIERFPSFRPRTEKAFQLLRRYDNIFILSFRFIYGIRIISPVVIGASGIGVTRFMILNFFAAIIWSVGSCVAAYYFAHLIMDYLLLMPKLILGVVASGGAIWYGVYKWRKRQQS